MYKELQKLAKKLNNAKFIRLHDNTLIKEIHAIKISLEYLSSLANIELMSDYNKAYLHMRSILNDGNYFFDDLYNAYNEQYAINVSTAISQLRLYKTVNDTSVAVISFESLSYTEFVDAISSHFLLLHVLEQLSKTKIATVCILSTSIYINEDDNIDISNAELYSVELNPKLTSLDDFNEFDFNILKSPKF